MRLEWQRPRITRRAAAFIAAIGTLVASTAPRAADYTWTAGSTVTWTTSGSNWSPSGASWTTSSSDIAYLAPTAVASKISGTVGAGGVVFTTAASDIYLGWPTPNTGTLYLNNSGTINNSSGRAAYTYNRIILQTGMTKVGSRVDLTGDITGTGDVNISGFTVITGGLGYSGALNLIDNTANVLLSSALPTGGGVSIAAGANLNLNGAGAVNQTIGILSGAGNLFNNTATSGTVTVGYGDVSSTFSGVIYQGSTGLLGLTKTGTGTLTLSGANTYTGITTLNAGVVNLGRAEVTGTFGPLGKSAASNPGNIVLNGGYLQYSSVNQTDYSGRFSTAANQRYNVDTNGQSVTWAAALSSSGGSLTKIGSGTLTLSGSNSYTGNTTVSAGQLTLAGSSALGTGTSTVSGGVLNISTYAPSVAGFTITSGSLVGTGTLTASNGYALQGGALNAVLGTGAITVTTGTTTLGSAGRFNSGSGLTVASGQLTLGGNETVASYAQTGGILGGSGNTLTAGTYALQGGTVNANLGAGTISVGGNTTLAGSAAAGTVNINAGTFTLSSGGLLASTAAVNATASGATLDISGLSGSGLTIGSLAGSAGSTVTLGGKTLTFGDGSATTFAGAIGGTGGITKQGAGVVTFSGSNGFSGATTINSGSISFGNKNAFSATSGISIADGAGLTYTGAADVFSRNITVSSGTGTVTNSGSGILTLGGTLTKNGTVLRLTGGAFNVTGQITGTSAKSDLYVDGATVTLSNTNSYNGPTFVYNGGTLALGTNSAIPSNSVVTLGGPGTGTLDLGTFTNSIGGLVFSGSGSGGTLKMAANQTVSAQLVTSSSLALGAGTTLDLAGMGTTAGLYRLMSYTSQTGTFATVTGLANGYQLVYGSTTLDAQQQAVLGAVTVTNPATAIITGGSAAFTYTVANSNASGGASLLFSSTSPWSNVAGSSSGTASAASTSGPIAGLVFTGTSVGNNQQGTFTVRAPAAYGSTTATGTVTVNVYGHAAGSATGATIALADSIVGYTGSLSGLTSATISNAAGYRVDLMTTGGTSAGFVNINNVSGIASGTFGMISAAASLDGSQTIGSNALGQVFSLTYADNSALAGASSNLGSQSITVTGKVLDHATSSLGASLLTSTTVSLGTYNYSTNTWESGGPTGFFDIYNIASLFGPSLTADLSLVNATGAANGFTTNLLSTYADIAGNGSQQFSIFFDPSGAQANRSTTFTISMSDKTGMAGATASNTLYVTANVIVVPEPGALALAGIGIGLAGWTAWSRRRSAAK